MAEVREKIEGATGSAKRMAGKVGSTMTEAVIEESREKIRDDSSGVVANAMQTVQDMAEGASNLVGNAKETAQEWASSIGDAAVQAKDTAQYVASATSKKISDLGGGLATLIRRYPVPALLLGIGVGYMVARVVRPSPWRSA